MTAEPLLTLDQVLEARERIQHLARVTPVVESTLLNERVGAHVFCKAENLQRTGSFKFRGATNAVASLDADERAAGVVTFSSGNHGQALSRAAGLHGVGATVVMPEDAPGMKKAATAHWGARIVEYDRYDGSRDDVAAVVLAESGGVLVKPYDDLAVMAGQGTLAVELFEQVDELDLLVVCVGGGGLLSGCATVARARNPSIRIVGVEPEASDDHVRSRAAGRRIELPAIPRTIADGQQVTAPGELTWPITNSLTDDFVTVSDAEIAETMRVVFRHLKLVVEPSGASALAALLYRDISEPGMRVGVTLSGGNVDTDTFTRLVAGANDRG